MSKFQGDNRHNSLVVSHLCECFFLIAAVIARASMYIHTIDVMVPTVVVAALARLVNVDSTVDMLFVVFIVAHLQRVINVHRVSELGVSPQSLAQLVGIH